MINSLCLKIKPFLKIFALEIAVPSKDSEIMPTHFIRKELHRDD